MWTNNGAKSDVGAGVVAVEVAELREGFGRRPGRWCGGVSERENRCRERGKNRDTEPRRGFGWAGVSESYMVVVRSSAKPPNLLSV